MLTHRHTGIDALKVLASQLIVWHHLSAYGPVADALHAAWPVTMDWLYGYGRMAVQVFLVLGGFLAVQSLMNAMHGPAPALVTAVLGRWRRLVPPFAVAMLLAVAAAQVARPWVGSELAGSPPGAGQALAHALLLHGVLGMESFSAGAWYVAIDFQLYALLALLLWLGLRSGRPAVAVALVTLTCATALLWWNRHAGLDSWGPYFMGAYGLGVLAQVVRGTTCIRRRLLGLAGLLALVAVALIVEWRTRVALAGSLALWLALLPAVSDRTGPATALTAGLASLGRSSYALFLLHFAVLLLGNAAWVAAGLHHPLAGITVALAIWLLSMALGWLFERHVERPLARRLQRG